MLNQLFFVCPFHLLPHLNAPTVLAALICCACSLILSVDSLLRSAVLDIVSDLLCSIPDEKFSSEHSLSMGLLLASFTCGTDEAVMAVAEGKKQDDSERVGSVDNIQPFFVGQQLRPSQRIYLAFCCFRKVRVRVRVCHRFRHALSHIYHYLYDFILFSLVVDSLTIAVLSPSVEHRDVSVTRAVSVAEGFIALGRCG